MGDGEQKARILIVEDEGIVALDMRSQLTELGYEVVDMVASGEEAVASAVGTRPDLILMDIRLKGEMDGVEAAERIRAAFDIPIIFITAYADEKTLARAKVTQAFGYILKPFQGREVLISIEMALYKHRIDYELRDSREWLKGTLNAITDAVIALDTEDRIEFMNREAETLFGMETAAAHGRFLGELCSFSESAALSGLSLRHREGYAAGNGSWVVLELPSRKLPVELIRTNIPGRKEGDFTGRVLAVRDISELVRAVETKSRLAAIVANSYDAIFAVRPDLKIVSWNFGAELMYGYVGGDMIGKGLPDLIPDERDRIHLRAIADQVLAGHEMGPFESARKCRSGKVIPISMSLSPVRDAGGRVVELSCIERDVSAEKEYEASLVKAKLAAEEASRTKSEFLSNMSHELRTPLNSIIGMIDLARDIELDGDQGEYLAIARQSADNLLFLINSILDFSKIETGKMQVHAIPFSLADAAADCIEGLSVQASRKGLYLLFRFDPTCPNKVIGDPRRFQQILANLITNGIKFTENGGVSVDLSFSRRSDGESIDATLVVRDTGIGMPHDRLDQIWEEFTQLDGSSTRSYGGTGLGLAIVKSLAELMGGSVRVESELKVGSVFTVVLPFLTGVGASASVEPIADLAGAEVVIASSDVAARTILVELLAAWGCVPLETGSAADLVERLHRDAVPRLFLIDEALPGRDLLFSCSEEEDCFSALKDRLVVMADGGRRKEALRRRLFASARFLVKPVRHDALLAMLLSDNTSTIPAGPVRHDRPSSATLQDGRKKGAGTTATHGDEDVARRLFVELTADPRVQEEIERFLQEVEALGTIPSVRLETSASRYRKILEDLRTEELPRTLLKVILACRRDDTDGVEAGLASIRSVLRACEDAAQ